MQSVSNDGKLVVKFDDDNLERSLRREDLIRVDALIAGLPVSDGSFIFFIVLGGHIQVLNEDVLCNPDRF